MNRGKIVILVILGVAIGISICGVWYRHWQVQHVLAAYTAPVAQLIAYAPEAELWQLGSPRDPAIVLVQDSGGVEIGGQKYPLLDQKAVADVRGFAKLRADLVRDSSYTWEDSPGVALEKVAPDWKYVLVLSEGSITKVRLAFSPASGQVRLLDSGPTLSIGPIAEVTKSLLAEQFPLQGKVPLVIPPSAR